MRKIFPYSPNKVKTTPAKLGSLLTLFFLLLIKPGWSLDAEASISAQEVGVGESFRIVVTVTSDKKIDNLSWPQIQGSLDPFTVTKNSGTSQSSQTTIVNGRVTQSSNYQTQFTYNLTPKKEGTFQIGPIMYAHGDFKKMLGNAAVRVVKTEAGMELQTIINKRKVYVGEQLRYLLRILPKSTVQNIQAPNIQAEIGKKFFIQQMDEKIEPTTVDIKGVPTRVIDIRYALFPLLSDNITFPAFTIDYEEVSRSRGRRNSVFDDFFGGGKIVKKQAAAQAVSIEVVPLPAGGPEFFSGAVGKYSLSASVDKTNLPSGEAITLTVNISGNGQPKSITKPKLPDLPGFEIFDPETQLNTKISGGELLSSKSFKYVLIPTRKGEYVIDPIQFAYFDPKSAAYNIASSQPMNISVSQGKEVASSAGRFMTQKEIESIGSDIRHIKRFEGELKNKDKQIYQSPLYWFSYLFAPLLFLSLFLFQSHRQKLEGDIGLRRKSMAKGVAKKRLTAARQSMNQDNPKIFYKALSQAVERFISDKMNFELRGLIQSEADQKLKARGIEESLRQQLFQLLEECDQGQFATSSKNIESWNSSYEKAESLINNLDKKL